MADPEGTCVPNPYAHNALCVTIGCVCVCGIAGNVVSFYLICRSVIKTSVTYQLLWLALMDTFYLVFCNVRYTGEYIRDFGQDDKPQKLMELPAYSSALFHIAITHNTWLIVFIAVYRYLAVCRGSSRLFGHAMRHGPKYSLLVLLLSIGYNVPYFFDQEHYRLHFSHGLSASCSAINDTHDQMHFTVTCLYTYANLLFVTVLPLLVLVAVVVKLLRVLNVNINSFQFAGDTNISVILLTIIVSFVVSSLPLSLYEVLSTQLPVYCGLLTDWMTIAVLITVVNASKNCLIYVALNKQFRRSLMACCSIRCKKRSNDEEMEMLNR